MRPYGVVSICSALMDVVTTISEEDLEMLALKKGYSCIVTEEQYKQLLEKIHTQHFSYEIGGSSLNAIRALALLEVKTAFLSGVGQDAYGDKIRTRFQELGIAGKLPTIPHLHSGSCMVLVTPDGERTMATFLGASVLFTAADIPKEEIQGARIFHCSGYQWFGPQKQVLLEALAWAKQHGVMISVDVSDPSVAQYLREDMLHVLSEYADVIFANREEAHLLFGGSPQKVAQELATQGKLAVIKLGSEGALLHRGQEQVFISAEPVTVVDTTAAGDMFAAGVLYGLLQERSLAQMGHMGAILAGDVIGHYGATLSKEAIHRLQTEFTP
jgi:sugar/nucleoside kinase (ribokinase family)